MGIERISLVYIASTQDPNKEMGLDKCWMVERKLDVSSVPIIVMGVVASVAVIGPVLVNH